MIAEVVEQTMTHPGHNPHLFRWMLSKRKATGEKVQLKKDDIDQWRKRVEVASEFAVSEVLSHKKPHAGASSRPEALQTPDQLRDHDDAYAEAQALLSDWLSSKLRLETDEEEEDEQMPSAERRRSTLLANAPPVSTSYTNFNDLYNHLAEEEEGSAVSSVLQDLMEREVLDCGAREELALDVGQTRRKFRDPLITMEARHQQVRENRARREAERQRRRRESEALRDAGEEARRRERAEETRRKQKAQREEEMARREAVRLRRQAEERRCCEQLPRQRERERMEGQRAARGLQSDPPLPTMQQQLDIERLCKEQTIQTKVHIHNLKCLQRHLSGWYSVVLDRRLRMGKARALYDWKRLLRAWRAWRGAVRAEQRQRELTRTEQELRAENRQSQLAVESDRKRLLRGCVNKWQLRCRVEREQRELLARQQETRRKMAALINSASAGKLRGTEAPIYQPLTAQPGECDRQDTAGKRDHHRSGTLAPDASAVHQNKTPAGALARPSQPWQVTRRHAAPTAAELREARQRGEGGALEPPHGAASQGGGFEGRHGVRQRIIPRQREPTRERREPTAQPRQRQAVISLELEQSAQLPQRSIPGGPRPKSPNVDPAGQRAPRAAGEPGRPRAPRTKAAARHAGPHPIITAMEARARRRAERREAVEALKRRRDEERLAELRAAEEQRQREAEEEKRRAAEKKREERRQEREREEEKRRQLQRQQELLTLARQHHRRHLLLRRGLAPWKRLVRLRQVNTQLAESHRDLVLLRRCARSWQRLARESLSQKIACADQLYRHVLLRGSLSRWKRLKDWRTAQEERAERFHRARTLRRFLSALLDHAARERLAEWDRRATAQEHHDRRAARRCLLAWRRLPCLQRMERAREERRERLGRKVAEVLPDFASGRHCS